MICEVIVYAHGVVRDKYSMNFVFIKPGEDVPIKITLGYHESSLGLDSKLEIESVHFGCKNHVILAYDEEKKIDGWKRLIHMFKGLQYVYDGSFKSDDRILIDEFGLKMDVGNLKGIYSKYGLHNEGIIEYDIFGTNWPSIEDLDHKYFTTIGKQVIPPHNPEEKY